MKRPLSFASDPFGYVATMIQKAIGSVLKLFAQLVDETSGVDWGNKGFLRTYTMMFGLATFVTAFLWLIAVGKRVVAGAGPAEAIGESIGYLLVAVVVSAFAPAAVAVVTDLVDEASAAMFRPVLGDIADLEDTLAQIWTVMLALGGGGFLATMLGSFLLFAVVSVWAELVVRSALLYVALAFGPLVFSGLVDRSLWQHTKRWLGATIAVIMSKPVTLTVLALATGILREFELTDTVTDPLTALQILFVVMALFFLAFLLPVAIGKFVPAFGDELATIAAARGDATERVRGAGSQAKGGADDMASTTGGRLDAASEMVQKGIDKIGGGAMKPPVGGDGEDGGAGVPTPDGVEGAGKAADGAGTGAGAAEAGAFEAAGPVGAGVGAAKQTMDEVKEFLGGAAQSGAERATGEDVGHGADSGGGQPNDAPPPPEEPPPPTPDDDRDGQR
ncbi:hypothetical protein BJF79_07465 [Actinomadura sp. CNU-125]|nr:hypothetical protein BJF79_07465 [Actinomadura sp. CNU-125]